MELNDEIIMKDVSKVSRFNGSTSRPYGWVTLDIVVHNKTSSIDFYLINYNATHNVLLGRH